MSRFFIVKWCLGLRWVAFTLKGEKYEPELGIEILGVVVSLYKGKIYFPRGDLEIREPGKREFGESLHPVHPRERR